MYNHFVVPHGGKDPDCIYKLATIAMCGVRVFAEAVASCSVSPLTKLAIKSLVKTVKKTSILPI